MASNDAASPAIGRDARANSEISGAQRPPLVLDLDGALLRTDLLHEAAIVYLKANPLGIFMLIAWLMKGKAVLKRRLNEKLMLEVDLLPVSTELVDFARAEHGSGRHVGIATASDELVAHRVARRFDFIDFVVASDGARNLKGAAKAEALRARFPEGFAYAGDSPSDLAVWQEAETVIVAGASSRTTRRASGLGKPMEGIFDRPRLDAGGWLKALRIHQWAKNALVFIPLVLSGMGSDPMAILAAGLAFVAMSVMASGTYLINDLFDLADDRKHWSKKDRPIASGRMGVLQAAIASVGLVGAGLALSAVLGPLVAGLIAAYLATTLAYSLYLKRQPIVDAFTLASLFTLRLGVGIAAVGAAPSAWLLVFSMFLFTSLSFAKRQTEIQRSLVNGRDRISGRGYRTTDAPMVLAMGVATGMGAITIMVLYIMNDAFSAEFYSSPVFLWGFPAVLFMWVSRIWLLSHREELNDDPVAFAIRDRVSLMLGAAMGLCFVAGWVL